MGIDKIDIKDSALESDLYVKKMHVVKVGKYDVAFSTAAAASKAYNALADAIDVSGYSGLSKVSHRVEDAQDPKVDLRLEHALVQVCTNDDLPVDGHYNRYGCDHHIVKNSDVCGIAKCYQSSNDKGEPVATVPEGWKVSERFTGDEGGEVEIVVTCPQCLKRLAQSLDIEVDEITALEVFEQKAFEQEVIKRNQNQ